MGEFVPKSASLLEKFETWLRLDSTGRTSDTLRGRALYMIALGLVISQIVNMVIMAETYGGWTIDHTISLIVGAAILMSIALMRYSKKYYLFAGFYSLLLYGGIIASAMEDFTGINTALLPYMILGTIVCGFISGWRMVLIFGATGLAIIWALYGYSAQAPTGALFDPALYEARNIQRAWQATLSMGLATAIAGFASYAMHSAFFALEKNADEARSLSQAKTEFMANLSHELRTPLNGVLGMNSLLAKTRLNRQQEEYAQIIDKCAKHLLHIIEDVLDIARLDEDKYEIELKPIHLKTVLEKVVALNQAGAHAKGLAIGIRYKDNLPENFIADAEAIRKIVGNLMSNAIKFTEKGSAFICVEGEQISENQYAMTIGVQDTGIGIDQKNLKKIFKRFSQLDTRLSRDEDGTGLGLALSKQLAEKLGGRLEVITRLGEGSTFMLKLVM
ncbi:MAG TPA: hypothetical protein ENK01_00930, partial [Hellea balneolensis]|nr:hypothetical protein [Hellea balneolensis]